LPTRSFRDLADLNAQARRWVLEEAGLRIHGTTRERPLERFAIERPLMHELPPVAPDLGSWHRVGTAMWSSPSASTPHPSHWSARRSGCAPPTYRCRSSRNTAWWPPTCARGAP